MAADYFHPSRRIFFVQFRHDILVVGTAAAGAYLRERVFVHDAFHHLLATGRCGQPDIFLVGIREESHGGANPPVVSTNSLLRAESARRACRPVAGLWGRDRTRYACVLRSSVRALT